MARSAQNPQKVVFTNNVAESVTFVWCVIETPLMASIRHRKVCRQLEAHRTHIACILSAPPVWDVQTRQGGNIISVIFHHLSLIFNYVYCIIVIFGRFFSMWKQGPGFSSTCQTQALLGKRPFVKLVRESLRKLRTLPAASLMALPNILVAAESNRTERAYVSNS